MSLKYLAVLALGMVAPAAAQDSYKIEKRNEGPPAGLAAGVKALPAYTLRHNYTGGELNTRWDDPNCRSSFVGHFSL